MKLLGQRQAHFKYSAKNEVLSCNLVPTRCKGPFLTSLPAQGFIHLLLFATLIAKPLLHKESDMQKRDA